MAATVHSLCAGCRPGARVCDTPQSAGRPCRQPCRVNVLFMGLSPLTCCITASCRPIVCRCEKHSLVHVEIHWLTLVSAVSVPPCLFVEGNAPGFFRRGAVRSSLCENTALRVNFHDISDVCRDRIKCGFDEVISHAPHMQVELSAGPVTDAVQLSLPNSAAALAHRLLTDDSDTTC